MKFGQKWKTKNGLGVQNISDLLLKEIYGIFSNKKPKKLKELEDKIEKLTGQITQ